MNRHTSFPEALAERFLEIESQGVADVPTSTSDSVTETTSSVVCWRCTMNVGEDIEHCPRCSARLQNSVILSRQSSDDRYAEARYFPQLFLSFGMMLTISVISGLVQSLLQDPQDLLIADSVAVIGYSVVAALAWRNCRVDEIRTSSQNILRTWVAAVVLLPLFVVINFGYMEGVRQMLGIPVVDLPFVEPVHIVWLFVLMTVFPAVFEEIFFRRVVLDGVFQHTTNTLTAVWISSLMFGMAHIGQPLGIPYLILLGVILAVLRLGSGSLVLPMLFHAAHNAAVLVICLLENL